MVVGGFLWSIKDEITCNGTRQTFDDAIRTDRLKTWGSNVETGSKTFDNTTENMYAYDA